MVLVTLLVGAQLAAGPLCTPAEVAAVEQALATAPTRPDPEADPGREPLPERRCGPAEARTVRQVLSRCRPAPAQAVLLMGGGRCLMQAGFQHEAAQLLRRFLHLLPQDPTVSPERARDRRDRVRRWLMQLGQEAPDTAILQLRSNLDGVQVRHLEHFPEGVILGAGETRLAQPPGPRVLSLTAPGFHRVELPVDLVDGEQTRAEVDWRLHLQPRYAVLLRSWDDFVRSGLTPAAYLARGRRPWGIAAGAVLVGAGAVLVGLCAAGAAGACNEPWKQGVAYSAAALLGGGGLLGLLSALAAPLERRPPPSLAPLQPGDHLDGQ
ncbi:MAG: hypothetical protein RMK29_14055 [Myxococcales bacterium]|nr:hypothetical protein [Myxococcota bacterium]MDW8282834.1 hypothetical protein [Myxococcales bacterium]